MWDMKYRTRSEYITALNKSLEENSAIDAEKMIEDFKRYFFKKNRQSIGDTDIILSLPSPEELGKQYAGKHYTKRRAVKKDGSAGIIKRFGIFLLNIFVYAIWLVLYLVFAAMLLGGVALVAVAGLAKANMIEHVLGSVASFVENIPFYNIFRQILENNAGIVFYIAVGIFLLMLAGTVLKALRRIMKKYRNWVLKVVSGRFRLPISMDDVYSKGWRVLVYILLPASLLVAIVCGAMMALGLTFIV